MDIRGAPGREHDTTALREHLEILPALATWIAENRLALGDLGYEDEAGTITVAFKKPKDGQLTDVQKARNKAHNGKRAVGERGNSVLKMTFKALRNISPARQRGRWVREAIWSLRRSFRPLQSNL